jgi:hypothetical protein
MSRKQPVGRLVKCISLAGASLIVFMCTSLSANATPTVGASVAGHIVYCNDVSIIDVPYSSGGAGFASIADGRSQTGLCAPPDGFDTGAFARSVAYASGTLKATASTVGPGSEADATAAFFNLITLDPPAGFTGSSVTGVVTMDITGTTKPGIEGSPATGLGCLSLEPGNTLCTPLLQNASGGPVHGSVTLPFELLLSDLTLGIGGKFVAGATNGGAADFGGTSETTVTLPPGWTYTSALGNFGIPAVPEPSTLLLLGIGLFSLIFAAGRHRPHRALHHQPWR